MKKNMIIAALTLFALTALVVSPIYAGDKARSTQSKNTPMTGKSGIDHNQRLQSSVRASELIGRDIINRNQEELGEVEDIVIGRDGRVNFLIVSHGGVLGIGDNLIPVPFSVIEQKADSEDKIILNMSKNELEKAPNFAKTEWPDFSDSNYEKDVHGYYGDTPGQRNGAGKYDEMKVGNQKNKSKRYTD